MFASVSLEGTSFGVMTDIEGFYSISKVPAGTYRLVVSSMEFETVAEEVLLIEDRISTRNYLLESKVISLGSAEVSADRQEQQTKVNMSVETIRPADLKKIPSFGGQPDLVQALQVLPGFISTGDQGGQLYIRGGSPIQNKVLLDGTPDPAFVGRGFVLDRKMRPAIPQQAKDERAADTASVGLMLVHLRLCELGTHLPGHAKRSCVPPSSLSRH